MSIKVEIHQESSTMELPRIYSDALKDHLAKESQMAFVSGPRQVGKTTSGKMLADAYLNWDDSDDRELILAGPRALVTKFGFDRLAVAPSVVMFDELHKYPKWKSYLKGLYDSYGERLRILVTGSSSLSVYRRGGDSLMGRYFLYRMHPLSVAEVAGARVPVIGEPFIEPRETAEQDFSALWQHGGFPDPYLRRDSRFSRRWQNLRFEQLVREDIRDLTQIQQLDQLASLAQILRARSGEQLVYENLARQVRVAVDTLSRWVAALSSLHFGFMLRPWFKNLARALRKEPKWYVRDWALVDDDGKRAETFVACHLLKAVEGWNDLGLGEFDLRYLRDKEGHEVDFLIVKGGEPWSLIEVKLKDTSIGKALAQYQCKLSVPFAFQVVVDADYVAANCFERPGPPIVVPARTFLSQLI